MSHSGSIVQGGFITGWLDAIMALACMCKVGSDVLVLSLEIKTSFIKSINPGEVIVSGKVIKTGSTIAFLEGEILDQKNNLIDTQYFSIETEIINNQESKEYSIIELLT